jgi:hypothetical protein
MRETIARSARLRGVVVLVTAAVLLTGFAVVSGRASSAPSLPAVSARQLLARAVRALSADPTISGNVAAHIDLGLPDLPDEGAAAATGPAATLISSLSGDHRLRVWHSPDGARVSDLLPVAERSIIVSRTDAWLWDSSSMTAVHLGPFGPAAPKAASTGAAAAALVDPVAIADRTLQALSPTTTVAVSGTTSVAGRDAYVLTLEPRTAQTLVGKVEVDVDAHTWLPLRAAVFARGAAGPAVSAGFTSVGFGPIDPSIYRFTPPPGAKVITPGSAVTAPAARAPMAPDPGYAVTIPNTPTTASGSCSSNVPCLTAPAPMASDPGYAVTTPTTPTTASGSCPPNAVCPLPARSRLIRSRRSAIRESANEAVRTFGSGWATIVAYRIPSLRQLQSGAGQGVDPLSFLPFSGPLFSVRLAVRGDHAWVLAGAVPQSSLERASAELP